MNMDVFFEVYKNMLQQGPGTNEETLKAFQLVPTMNKYSKVLDIGCGTGRQTLAIAQNTNAYILAIDNYQGFLDILKKNAEKGGFKNVYVENKSMFELNFDNECFDLIWCECAVYFMGFEKALKEWRSHLKIGGYMVVTDVSFVRKDVPDELREFWESEYPSMCSIDDHCKIIKETGYELIDEFKMKKTSWSESYYKPMKIVLDKMKEKYKDNVDAMEVINAQYEEKEFY
ncbi:class I SAM-dependent methyltransferase, partial [bacterium]